MQPLKLDPGATSRPESAPYTVLKATWAARNGLLSVLAFNNRACLVIEQLTGISAFAFAFAPRPGFAYQAVLAFGCSASWRAATGHGELTLDQWIDEWMPHYFSDDYHQLVRTLEELIGGFPDAAEHKQALVALSAPTHQGASALKIAKLD